MEPGLGKIVVEDATEKKDDAEDTTRLRALFEAEFMRTREVFAPVVDTSHELNGEDRIRLRARWCALVQAFTQVDYTYKHTACAHDLETLEAVYDVFQGLGVAHARSKLGLEGFIFAFMRVADSSLKPEDGDQHQREPCGRCGEPMWLPGLMVKSLLDASGTPCMCIPCARAVASAAAAGQERA